MKAPALAFWGRALAVWLLIAVLETVHGIVRGLWLVPALGEVAASGRASRSAARWRSSWPALRAAGWMRARAPHNWRQDCCGCC